MKNIQRLRNGSIGYPLLAVIDTTNMTVKDFRRYLIALKYNKITAIYLPKEEDHLVKIAKHFGFKFFSTQDIKFLVSDTQHDYTGQCFVYALMIRIEPTGLVACDNKKIEWNKKPHTLLSSIAKFVYEKRECKKCPHFMTNETIKNIILYLKRET